MLGLLFVIVIDYIPKYSEKAKRIIHTGIKPFKWLGMNPLAIYILMTIGFEIMRRWIEIDG